MSVCDLLATKERGSSIAIFSHNLSIKTLLCHGFGVELRNFRRLSISNGSVSVIDISPVDEWLVNSVNDIPKLGSK